MATLHHSSAPSSSHTFGTTYATVTGYSATVTIGATSSAVLIIAQIPMHRTSGTGIDQTIECQVTRGGSGIGPEVVTAYHDSTDQRAHGMIAYVDTGVSGSQTYAIQGRRIRDANTGIDTNVQGSFVIIELTSSEATLRTASSSASNTCPSTWANMTGMSLTYTPASSSSVHILICSQLTTLPSGDKTLEARFAVGGTREGGFVSSGTDSTDEGCESTLMHATTGHTGSTTFSCQWQIRKGAAKVRDTGKTSYFQSLELTNADILTDITSGTGNITTSWTTVPSCSSTVSVDSTSSVVLFAATSGFDIGGSGEETADYSFADGGTREGPECSLGYEDNVDEFFSLNSAWAKDSISGSRTFTWQWFRREDHASGSIDTDRRAQFQVIDIKTAAAGVDIAVPLDTFTMTDNVPAVASGASVATPLDTMTMTDNVPAVGTSVLVNVPLDTFTMTDNVPAVASGASAAVPVDTMTMTDNTPSVETGVNIDVPLDTMTMTDNTPSIRTGVNIDVPLDTMTMTDRVPTISAGVEKRVIVNHMHVRNGTGLGI